MLPTGLLSAAVREDPMRKKRQLIVTIFFIILLLVGLSVMLYPIISDWWNSRVQSVAIANYNTAIANMDDSETEKMLEDATEYNKKLIMLSYPFMDYKTIEGYDDVLNISGSGVMGYITIPAIRVEIPIYHGTSKEVLNVAAGHLQGSTLPVGGENTHSVISAHRGLPSARLFTDLDKIVVGDTFTITILDKVFTYEVEEIFIVKPEEMSKLAIVPKEDYVTLMTCTPYGVNTHRLLLRSKRIETKYVSNSKVTADAVQVDPVLVVPFIAFALFIVLLFCWFVGGRKKKNLPYQKLHYSLTKFTESK